MTLVSGDICRIDVPDTNVRRIDYCYRVLIELMYRTVKNKRRIKEKCIRKENLLFL